VILPGESQAEFEALAEQIRSEFRPQNVIEELLVKEIIDVQWRLGRLLKIETTIFSRKGISFSGHECGSGFAFINDASGLDSFGKLSRYEEALSRRFFKCLRDLRLVREKGWATNDDDPEYECPENYAGFPQPNKSAEENPDVPNAPTPDGGSGPICAVDIKGEERKVDDAAPEGLEPRKHDPPPPVGQIPGAHGADGTTADPGDSAHPGDIPLHPNRTAIYI
jgi:hypothetical protein